VSQEITVRPDDTILSHWPKLSVGEEIAIKGVGFVVARLNRSSVVLRPMTAPHQAAGEIMRKLSLGRRKD